MDVNARMVSKHTVETNTLTCQPWKVRVGEMVTTNSESGSRSSCTSGANATAVWRATALTSVVCGLDES